MSNYEGMACPHPLCKGHLKRIDKENDARMYSFLEIREFGEDQPLFQCGECGIIIKNGSDIRSFIEETATGIDKAHKKMFRQSVICAGHTHQ